MEPLTNPPCHTRPGRHRNQSRIRLTPAPPPQKCRPNLSLESDGFSPSRCLRKRPQPVGWLRRLWLRLVQSIEQHSELSLESPPRSYVTQGLPLLSAALAYRTSSLP